LRLRQVGVSLLQGQHTSTGAHRTGQLETAVARPGPQVEHPPPLPEPGPAQRSAASLTALPEPRAAQTPMHGHRQGLR
jgi:hypothetical protein